MDLGLANSRAVIIWWFLSSEMGESEKDAIQAASNEISNEMKSLVNKEAIEKLKQTQHLILGRLQDSNAVLSHFNEHSEDCFTDVIADFTKNTRILKTMKTDLDHIFLKLRSMKAKVAATYPDAFPNESSEVIDTGLTLQKNGGEHLTKPVSNLSREK
ncbi:kxDL motif-containing protein LO9-177-like [Silene latifolia]|uniref:kxDL motif-containing protein LO9-177-like n=1 Tax=Silene latifolia TaxID=37657 RepID=UPI003D76B183